MKLCVVLATLLAVAAAKPQANKQSPAPRRWGIVDYAPDQSVSYGQTISLYARVGQDGITENDDWKECVWRRETDQAKCTFFYECRGALCGIGSGDFSIRTTCDVELYDVTFFGDDPNEQNQMCGINIPFANYDDNSPWTVTIEECDIVGCGTSDGNGEFSSKTINVKVN